MQCRVVVDARAKNDAVVSTAKNTTVALIAMCYDRVRGTVHAATLTPYPALLRHSRHPQVQAPGDDPRHLNADPINNQSQGAEVQEDQPPEQPDNLVVGKGARQAVPGIPCCKYTDHRRQQAVTRRHPSNIVLVIYPAVIIREVAALVELLGCY